MISRYLQTRSEALLNDDYFESDLAWLDINLDCDLDVTIGPYETYEDRLFGYKGNEKKRFR